MAVALPGETDEGAGVEAEDVQSGLGRWVKFVQFHNIEPADVWEGRLSMPTMQFVDVF